MYASGASPMVQWLWSSTVRPAAAKWGPSSRTASVVSSPPGSLR